MFLLFPVLLSGAPAFLRVHRDVLNDHTRALALWHNQTPINGNQYTLIPIPLCEVIAYKRVYVRSIERSIYID